MDSTISSTTDTVFDRSSLKAASLTAMTIICLGVSLWIASPFLPAIVWSVALAVAAYPLHSWIAARMQSPAAAAGLSVLAIVLMIIAPVLLIVQQVIAEWSSESQRLEGLLESSNLDAMLSGTPYTERLYSWLKQHMDFEKEAGAIQENIRQNFTSWLKSTLWTFTQFLVTIFLLFYMFKDKKLITSAFKSFAPLSSHESNIVLSQVGSMIYATVYGTVGVAAIQGFLGGLMFWVLGLPAPLLWGSVMMLLSIIPVFGAFVVWVPAAMGLLIKGSWIKALILTIWGAGVVSLVDNLLYPILVGKSVRIHTVPVFLSIAGGLIIFGVSGLVIGPAVLALTLTLLEILKQRTARGHSAREPVKAAV